MHLSPSPSEMAAMLLRATAAAVVDSASGTACAGRGPGRVAQ
jgi:hypothetical protein